MSDTKKKITLSELGLAESDPSKAKPEVEAESKPAVITPNMAKGAKKTNSDTAAGLEIVDSVEEIAKKAEVVAPEKEYEKQLLDEIDAGFERNKKEMMEEVIQPMKDKLIAAKLEAEISAPVEADPLAIGDVHVPMVGEDIKKDIESDLNNLNLSAVKMDEKEIEEILSDMDNEDEDATDQDLSKLNEEEEEELKKWTNERRVEYQNTVKEKLQTGVKLGNGNVRISTVPISASKILSNVAPRVVDTASVPLIHTGRMMTFSALVGDEIPMLNSQEYDGPLEAARQIYTIIYNHDMDPNKPVNFDVWLKSICEWDTLQLYWGLYKATFKNTNFLTYNCPECGNTFIKEAPIEDMIRIHPDSINEKALKERIDLIIKEGNNSAPSRLKSEFVQISADYGVSIKAPSIYTILFETSALDKNFIRKYSQIINIASHIDAIYKITNGVAVPVNTTVRDDVTKSAKIKIVTLYKILQTMSTDETGALNGHIVSIRQHIRDAFQYIIPATDCEGIYGPVKDKDGKMLKGKVCTHHFDEQTMASARSPITPLELLFIRHQLAQLANFTIESE